MPPPAADRSALIQHMLQALETPSTDLTKWEQNFVASVGEQFARRKSLSDRQIEVLDSIYSEHTA